MRCLGRLAWASVGMVLPTSSRAHTGPALLDSFKPPRVELDTNITVSVSPTMLMKSGEWVTIMYAGIESWKYPDAFVAAFSPGSVLNDPATITRVAPIKYQYLTAERPLLEDAIVDDKTKAGEGEGEEAGAGEKQGELSTVQTLRFRLLNMRDPEGYSFGLFKGGIENPVLVAKTEEPVMFARPYEVMHLHLALTAEANSMRVSWVTGAASQSPAVRYRKVTGGAGSWEEAAGETLTYTREDMCGAPATTKGFHDPGLQHSAILTGLSPGKGYEYQAGDKEASEWSESTFFFAPPEPLAKPSGDRAAVSSGEWGPEVVKMGVFGDMGTAEVDGTLDAGHSEEVPSLQTIAHLKEQLGVSLQLAAAEGGAFSRDPRQEPPLSLVLHIGDLSYARGYDAQWDEYLDQIAPIASVVPWMVGVGNHERDSLATSPIRPDLPYYTGTDSGGDCGVATAFRFLMPGDAGKPLEDKPWYGFDHGPVHFTIMSTEHDFTPGSTQYLFIEEDLAGVDRTKTPWLVFAGHRPMYVNSGGPGASDCEGPAKEGEHCATDQPVARLMRSSLEPLLLRYQVDLSVYGHHHSYQRTCKVADMVCKGVSTQNSEGGGYVAPVHVVLGMAGMGLSQNMVSPPPEWLEYATDREFGLCTLVADRSKLQLSFILNSDGQMVDQLVLTKPEGSVGSVGSVGGEAASFALDEERVGLRHSGDGPEGSPRRAKIARALGERHARWSKRGHM